MSLDLHGCCPIPLYDSGLCLNFFIRTMAAKAALSACTPASHVGRNAFSRRVSGRVAGLELRRLSTQLRRGKLTL